MLTADADEDVGENGGPMSEDTIRGLMALAGGKVMTG